jgi:hypothetical protein
MDAAEAELIAKVANMLVALVAATVFAYFSQWLPGTSLLETELLPAALACQERPRFDTPLADGSAWRTGDHRPEVVEQVRP